MRLWSIHPKYLDVKGLVALWREGLLAQNVLLGNTKGYTHHPQLNRFRDTNNPLGLVPTWRYNFGFTWRPTSKLNTSWQYQVYHVWKKFRKEEIMAQKILRGTVAYQFTKNLNVRLISEYNISDRYSSSYAAMVDSKNFAFEPLVSYKLNAFSAVDYDLS